MLQNDHTRRLCSDQNKSAAARLRRLRILVLLVGLLTFGRAGVAEAQTTVVLAMDAPALGSAVEPAVAAALSSRQLKVVTKPEVNAALAFGGFSTPAPGTARPDAELVKLRGVLSAAYLVSVEARANGAQHAVRVRIFSDLGVQQALGMTTAAAATTDVTALVIQALDKLGTAPATAPAAGVPVQLAPAAGAPVQPVPAAGVPVQPAPAAGASVQPAPATGVQAPAPVAPPPEAATEEIRGAPEGWFGKIQVGGGSFSLKPADFDADISGIGPVFHARVGTMFGQLAVGLSYDGGGTFSPELEANGESMSLEDTSMQMGGLSAFFSYYPDLKDGLHITGRAGLLLTTVTFEDEDSDSSSETHGYVLGAGIGKDWRFGASSFLGLTAELSFGNTSGDGPDPDEDADYSATLFGVYATYTRD